MAKTYHMRYVDKEIKNKKKLVKILKETNFVTLALVKDDEPYMRASYNEETGCLYIARAIWVGPNRPWLQRWKV